MRLFSLLSTKALAAAIILYLLQLNPYTGLLVMFVGGPLGVAVLLDVFLAALFVEAWKGKVAFGWILVPVIAVGLFYGLYADRWWDLHRQNAALLATNPKQVMTFDPARQSLIDDRLSPERYAVPVVYEPWGGKGEYRASRLFPRDQCRDLRQDTQGHLFWISPQAPDGTRSLCLLTMTEQPALPPVTVARSRTDGMPRDADGSERVDVRVGDDVKASYQVLHAQRLVPFPLFVAGCFLVDEPASWQCMAHFMSWPVTMDGYGVSAAGQNEARPEEVMLGLRRYSDADINHYRGFVANQAALTSARGEADRVRDTILDAFRQLVAGADDPMPFGASYAVGQNMTALAPLAPGIAARFAALTNRGEACRTVGRRASCQFGSAETPNRGEQLRVLASALAALPPAAYRGVAPTLFDIMQQPGMDDAFPLLYVRSADIGAPGLAAFAASFRSGGPASPRGIPPLLGLCRIGALDEATVAELKRRFLAPHDSRNNDYRAALALALIATGEQAFVAANPGVIDQHGGTQWLAAVLGGMGKTAAGPANCMIKSWHDSDAMNPNMQPSVIFRGRNGYQAVAMPDYLAPR